MSHPDPLFDPDNCLEDDEMFLEPDDNDVPFVEYLYDDHDDFYGENVDYSNYNDDRDVDDSYDDDMDGDAESAFGSCGWGVDEYYNDTPMYDDYYDGE